MYALLTRADALLRGTPPFGIDSKRARTAQLLLLILIFAPIYGAVMGSFELSSTERLPRIFYSALKAPLLLLATSAICLPGFIVLNTILGLRDDFAYALRAIVAGQAALSIALASLAPFTRFFYFSSVQYRQALIFNAAMFALAAAAGHLVMLRFYRGLMRRNANHRIALYAWLVLYAFVGMQMGWTLRPFVGAPNLPVTFFREEPFTNAYVTIFRLFTNG